MVNFTPGPSQLYFTVADHLKKALRENIPSISHRSKPFEKIVTEINEGLRELLSIPANYSIFFTSSATEIWERSIENLVERKSFHFVNGAFSKRYCEIAMQLHKVAEKYEVTEGDGFYGNISIPEDTEVIAITHNETSTGVCWPPEQLHSIKKQNPRALVVVDAVSSLPHPTFDFEQVDSVFFSVQKAFGLPAGLGVWMVNEQCIAKAETLQKKNILIGTYHNLPTLHAFGKRNQTPETPNVLGIYLLSKLIQDFLRRGIQAIRNETRYKAAVLYQALEEHNKIKPFVSNPMFRSETVIVAETGVHTHRITEALQEKGLYPGDGYGKAKDTQLRFANFPTHSKEHYEALADAIRDLQL